MAISLPEDLLASVERLRAETSETRSGLVRRALEKFLKDLELAERVCEYVEGYNRQPETDEEVDAAEASATELLADEEWE